MVSHVGPPHEIPFGRPRAPEPPSSVRPNPGRVLKFTVALLAVAAFFALKPLWVPMILAIWTAILVRPLYKKLSPQGKARKRAAGVLTVVGVLLVLAPFAIIALSLTGEAVQLVDRVLNSKNGANVLQTLTASEGGGAGGATKMDLQHAIDLARRHGMGAMGTARTLFGAATAMVIGLVVFVFGFYTFLVDGRRAYDWFLERSPIPRAHFMRLGAAFVETGRGLMIGVGLTALLQGAVATIGYVVIGVPQALVLGLVTVFTSLIPSVGSGLVWVPVTIGLAATGRSGAAIAMLAIGLFVSVVDNFVRPWLSRYGKLEMPTFLLFVAMLGGITAFGTWGLLLGPLFVRLAAEGLSILRDARKEQQPSEPTPTGSFESAGHGVPST